MNPARSGIRTEGRRGSAFIIVLWIAFGLVSLALYFAQSMVYELRAGDNRVAGLAAGQAIEGAARYVGFVLGNQLTNGVVPEPLSYGCEEVVVANRGINGDDANARFWLIGRETNSPSALNQVTFGLVDEASKLNLNSATSNMLIYLPRMTPELAEAIIDWRGTNGTGATYTWYGMQRPPYECKCSPFETVDELRLLMGTDMELLAGEDLNRNGVLDQNEPDDNRNGQLDPGLLDYVTVYSREPNTYSNGVARCNVRNLGGNSSQALQQLLEANLSGGRAQQVLQNLNLGPQRGPGGGQGPGTLTSPLQFFLRSGMTAEEFGSIADKITVVSGDYITGRVNINTASLAVLECLPGVSENPDIARMLVSYRSANPDKLTSIAWVVEALGQNNASVLNQLQARDCLTTQSFQFTADIAALGPHGRGYRRVRFVFDTTSGLPRIVYRQDLTHLGWALGKEIHEKFLLPANMRS